MKLDRVAFVMFLCFLLVAPRLAVGSLGVAAERSTASLGIVGLGLWMAGRPGGVGAGLGRLSVAGLLFGGYCIYGLFPSVVWEGMRAGVGPLQLASYGIVTVTFVAVYVESAMRLGMERWFAGPFCLVGGIVAAGALASLFAGPIYPSQVGDVGRNWGGLSLPQAVGFGVTQNGTAGILLVFLGAAVYLLRRRARRAFLVVLIGVALLGTLSRSAILGAVVAWVVVAVRRMTVAGAWRLGAALVAVGLGAGLVLEGSSGAKGTVVGDVLADAVGVGAFSTGGSEAVRLEQWANAARAWADARLEKEVFGGGFRSFAHVENGVWISSHSSYLEVLNDFGIVGLGLLAGGIGVAWLRAFRIARKETAAGSFCLFSLTGLAVHACSETFFYGVEYLVMVGLVIAVLQAGARTDGGQATRLQARVQDGDRGRGRPVQASGRGGDACCGARGCIGVDVG